MRVYRRNESVEECFTSGCVDLEFKKMANQNRGRGFVLRLDSELLRVPLFLLWVVCGGAFIITAAVGVGSVCSCCSC